MHRLAVVSSIAIQRMVRGYIMRCRAGREVAQARLKVLTAYYTAEHYSITPVTVMLIDTAIEHYACTTQKEHIIHCDFVLHVFDEHA
jgi:hypothetical protein